ncbi:hypothetical protein FPV67DRAFT_1450230 [Lyophyllum atratum]|nr:hypothetical protein FPV67DRAFT_1450230 [Lyophyllum atratum]
MNCRNSAMQPGTLDKDSGERPQNFHQIPKVSSWVPQTVDIRPTIFDNEWLATVRTSTSYRCAGQDLGPSSQVPTTEEHGHLISPLCVVSSATTQYPRPYTTASIILPIPHFWSPHKLFMICSPALTLDHGRLRASYPHAHFFGPLCMDGVWSAMTQYPRPYMTGSTMPSLFDWTLLEYTEQIMRTNRHALSLDRTSYSPYHDTWSQDRGTGASNLLGIPSQGDQRPETSGEPAGYSVSMVNISINNQTSIFRSRWKVSSADSIQIYQVRSGCKRHQCDTIIAAMQKNYVASPKIKKTGLVLQSTLS